MTDITCSCFSTNLLVVSVGLGLWLAGTDARAGELRIVATPGVVNQVEAAAEAFEANHAGDQVRIVVSSETELKGQAKKLPVQLVVSDDTSLIEWMEARELIRRPAMVAAVHVPLAVVVSSSNGVMFASIGDLLNRMKQQGTTIAIPNPQKTDCGRRAQALLKTVGVGVEPSERLVFAAHAEEVIALVQNEKAHFGVVFAPDAMTAKGVAIHAVSAHSAFSPVHTFAVNRGQEGHAVAQRFLAFVNSPEGQNAFKTRGYELAQASQLVGPPTAVAARPSFSISRW